MTYIHLCMESRDAHDTRYDAHAYPKHDGARVSKYKEGRKGRKEGRRGRKEGRGVEAAPCAEPAASI